MSVPHRRVDKLGSGDVVEIMFDHKAVVLKITASRTVTNVVFTLQEWRSVQGMVPYDLSTG